MFRKFHLPSPALVVALIALFVTLSGIAAAAAPVPRALVADNAKKLGGKTLAQVLGAASATSKKVAAQAAAGAAQQPGPASTAAGLVVIKTAAGAQLPAGGLAAYTISCDPGQSIMSAGFQSDGLTLVLVQSNPTSQTSWTMGLGNIGSTPANIILYATCLK